jgi:hypothetical protein
VRVSKAKPDLSAQEAMDLIKAIEAAGDPQAPKQKRVRVSKAKTEMVAAPKESKRISPRLATAAASVPALATMAGETLYKMESTPKGYALFTYTCAVLTTIGMFTAGRPATEPGNLVKFFRSKKILDHHAPNLEYTADKKLRLSVAGWNYFHGRITGSNYSQRVLQPEVDMLVTAFRTGEITEKTEHFSPTTRMVPIKG